MAGKNIEIPKNCSNIPYKGDGFCQKFMPYPLKVGRN
jgi:hypothetical protein